MTRFHSILKLTSPDTAWCYVMTQSQKDEEEIIHLAEQEGKTVIKLIAAENSGRGIFLSDFPN
jgi:hypothetical protein